MGHGQTPFVREETAKANTVFDPVIARNAVTKQSPLVNAHSVNFVIASGAKQSPHENSKLSGVVLKEELIGATISGIKGEGEAVTKVSYFRGSDPSKWKSGIATYKMVSLGEVYEGIELKLKAYGNNVEKLFCIKPGADPNQIKICLSGLQPSECSRRQPPESPFIKGDLTNSPLAKGARGLWISKYVVPTFMVVQGQGNGASGLWIDEKGHLVAGTAL